MAALAARKWIFQNCWRREILGSAKGKLAVLWHDFAIWKALSGDLRQSGFDTVHLRMQLHKEFSVPLTQPPTHPSG